MGIEIGFVNNDKIDWAPKPGWQFWESLWPKSFDELGDGGLILSDIEETLTEFRQSGNDDRAVEMAEEFREWCKNYWQDRRLTEKDKVGITLDF